MDNNPGKELLHTFHKLGIDLGNCGLNVIEGWFDDSENADFLIWLTKSLSEENVIYENEILEYEENVRRNVVPNDNEYQNSVDKISEKYPGIFDINEAEFDIECLEDETNMLLEDKNKLDDILQLHENLYIKEKSSLVELEAEHVKSITDLEKAEEDCLKQSYDLDELNNKLYEALTNCSEKLLEYEYPFTATYISNIPLNRYSHQYKQIISYFGLLDKKEFATLPKLQSAVKTCSKLDGSMFHEKSYENLSNLKKKLFQSIQNRNYAEAIKEQLEAELNFMNHMNIDELCSLRSKEQLEDNIQFKSDHYDILSLELGNLALEISEKYGNFPSIDIAKQEIKVLQAKLDNVKEFENIFLSILSYHTLLYFSLLINNSDIQKSDQFFRVVHRYIGNNLTKCELRTESMNDIIRQYKVYEKIPFQERSILMQVLCRLIENNISKSDLDRLNNFHLETSKSNLIKNMEFSKEIRLIENNNRLLTSFLTNGPTSEVKVIPYKVYEMFNHIDNVLHDSNKVVTTTVSIWKDAMKQGTENEWIKYKRQLWIYFLMQPQKVLIYIRKLEDEVNRLE